MALSRYQRVKLLLALHSKRKAELPMSLSAITVGLHMAGFLYHNVVLDQATPKLMSNACLRPIMGLPMRQLLWLALLSVLGRHAEAQLSIARYQPNRGSIAGGTKIEFQGSGIENPKVLIGPYECDVDLGSITSSTLDCHTRAALDYGVYNLTVINTATAEAFTLCCFTFSREMSPSLMLVEPSAGPPNTSPVLAGEYTGTLYWYWSNRESSGRVDYINKVLFGSYHCYFSDQAGSDVFAPSSEYNSQLAYLRQEGTYRLQCDLPNKDNTWSVEALGNPGLGVAGNLNVTLSFAEDFRSGIAVAKAPVYTAARDGTPHMFQLHAQVDSVSPNTGSLAGGTLVTIQGFGFPSSLDLTTGKATAFITTAHNTSCKIVESRYNEIKCIMQPAAVPTSAAQGVVNEAGESSGNTAAGGGQPGGDVAPPGVGVLWPGGLVVGPRGWVYDIFVNNRTASMSSNQLIQSANWTMTAANNGTRRLLTDSFEGQNYSTPYHMSRGLGFFIAPKTGTYKFTMIGDDLFHLQGLYHNGTSWRLVNLVGSSAPVNTYCSMYEWSCSRGACSNGACTSAGLQLQAGQPLLLSAKNWNGPSVGSWQVGVRIPSIKPNFFSISEVQRVTIPYTQVPRSQVLTLLFRPPSDAGIDVVIKVQAAGLSEGAQDLLEASAAANTLSAIKGLQGPLAVLNNPRIGVNLTIRGVKIPVFAPNITATALQGLINQALRTGIGPTAQLGVEILSNPAAGTLTYRLLANRTAFVDDLPPSDVVAELLVLPPPPPPLTADSPTTSSSDGSPSFCLQRSSRPKTLTYANADGTDSSIVVYEEVWENVTVPDGSSTGASIAADEAGSNGATLLGDGATEVSGDAEINVLSGVSISVTQPLEPPPVGGQAQGLWQVFLEGRIESGIDVSWDISTSKLQTALRSLQASVSLRCRDFTAAGQWCAWREGVLIGRSWIISWPVEAQNAVTSITARPKPGGFAPDYMLTAASVDQVALPPLSGGVMVAFGDYCDTVNITVTDTAYGVANKLNSLPGIKGASVRLDGNIWNSMTWTITYDSYSNPGKQPLLRIADQSTLLGWSGSVQVTRLVEGSTDHFYGPIPGELMRQAVDATTYQAVGLDRFPSTSVIVAATPGPEDSQQPLQLLDVYVNSVLSSCGATSDARGCSFSYTEYSTPVVNSVNPLSLTAGGNLTITGSGFATGNATANHVWLAGSECTVLRASATELVCATDTTTAAGQHEVIVSVDRKGLAQYLPANTTDSLGSASESDPEIADPIDQGQAQPAALLVVNITAAPTATMQVTAVFPNTISLLSITQLSLTVTNMPNFVLTDHTGEAVAAAVAAAPSLVDAWYLGHAASSFESRSRSTELTTASFVSWVSVVIANVSCPILSCKGSSSTATLKVLFPGHEVYTPKGDINGLDSAAVDAVVTVRSAEGSTPVTRRRLIALSHPPLLYIPRPAVASTNSKTHEKTLEPSDEREHDEPGTVVGLVEDVIESLEDWLQTAVAAASSKVQRWAAFLDRMISRGTSAAKSVWGQYVQKPREARQFQQALRLTSESYRVAGWLGKPTSTNWHSSKATTILHKAFQPSQLHHHPRRPLQLRQLAAGHSSGRLRQLLAAPEGQAAVIAEASHTVELSSSIGVGVKVRQPGDWSLKSYGQTTIVFEVSGIDITAVLQARLVPLSTSVPTSVMQADRAKHTAEPTAMDLQSSPKPQSSHQSPSIGSAGTPGSAADALMPPPVATDSPATVHQSPSPSPAGVSTGASSTPGSQPGEERLSPLPALSTTPSESPAIPTDSPAAVPGPSTVPSPNTTDTAAVSTSPSSSLESQSPAPSSVDPGANPSASPSASPSPVVEAPVPLDGPSDPANLLPPSPATPDGAATASSPAVSSPSEPDSTHPSPSDSPGPVGSQQETPSPTASPETPASAGRRSLLQTTGQEAESPTPSPASVQDFPSPVPAVSPSSSPTGSSSPSPDSLSLLHPPSSPSEPSAGSPGESPASPSPATPVDPLPSPTREPGSQSPSPEFTSEPPSTSPTASPTPTPSPVTPPELSPANSAAPPVVDSFVPSPGLLSESSSPGLATESPYISPAASETSSPGPAAQPSSPEPLEESPLPAPVFSPAPAIDSMVTQSLITEALSQRLAAAWGNQQYACRNLTLLNATHASCQAGPFPHGTYGLVVTLSDGPQLAAPETLHSILTITNISPPLGSIGGGTLLTITGQGFDAEDTANNVVGVPVDVSTSYPNGVVLCDLVDASYTRLRCRTRPHLAANAKADDPAARARVPTESKAATVHVVRCSNTQFDDAAGSGSNGGAAASPAAAGSRDVSSSSAQGYGSATVDADVVALKCWSDRQAGALATCSAGEGSSCTFFYSSSATPVVTSVVPPVLHGTAAETLTVQGAFIDREPLQVLLLPAHASAESIAAAARVARGQGSDSSSSATGSSLALCQVVRSNASAVECRLPDDLLPGAWQAILMHQNGEMSVISNAAAVQASAYPLTLAQAAALASRLPVFVLRPVLSAVSTQFSGAGGGTVLNITLGEGSAAFNVDNPEANQVLIGGVPCTLDPTTLTPHSLSVTAPPVTGRYFAEYWQLPLDSWSMPYFDGLGPPHARRVEHVIAGRGLSFGLCGNSVCGSPGWGPKGPSALAATVVDQWAARITFYLRVPFGGNTTLWFSVDDQVMVTIYDLADTLVINKTVTSTGPSNPAAVVLPAMPSSGGQLRVVLSYIEYTGSAYLRMTWDGPSPANIVWARSTIPPQAVSLVPSGTVLPLAIVINGIPAVNNCTQAFKQTSELATVTATTLSAPGQRTYGEPRTIAAPVCEGFAFSGSLGPSISGLITPNSVNKTGTVLVVPLLAPAGTAASDLVVNIGGKFCQDLQLFVDVNLTTIGANVTVNTDIAVLEEPLESAAVIKLQCTAPALPAGVYTFQLMHAAWGAAGVEPHVPNISLTYTPSISKVTSGAASSSFSPFGGVTLNITGFGFAPMVSSNSAPINPGGSPASDPGSLTTAALHHFAVAITPLLSAAPGVVGIPLIPWDLTQPSSIQHLAPKNPPSAQDVAAAGLTVAATSVAAPGRDIRCMVTEATETWISCKLQRSSLALGVHNLLQVSVLGLDNVTRTVTATAEHMSYLVGTTQSPLTWYVNKVTDNSSGSSTLQPLTAATLRVTMNVPASVAAQLLQAPVQSLGQANLSASSSPAPLRPPPAAGNASLASGVFVVCNRRVYECSTPTVQTAASVNFSPATHTVYQETLTCTLPASGLPASTVCEAVVELPRLGFSGYAFGKSDNKVNVALELVPGSLQPNAGSMAGGQMVTIWGKGFDTYNSSAVRVLTKTLSSTPVSWCQVTKVTPTSITCTTLPAPTAVCDTASDVPCTLSVWLNPSDGSEFAASALGTYTYSPDLTPVITSVNPIRGSTEGGTLITITGTNLSPVVDAPAVTGDAAPPAAGRKLIGYSVSSWQKAGYLTSRSLQQSQSNVDQPPVSIGIGGVPCTNVVVRDASTITCETGKPAGGPAAKPQGPQALLVAIEGKGSAAPVNPAAPISYEYVDLWSRRTTWGGLEPPVTNDSVVVPAGTTVMLDVSPPVLYMLLIEGTLFVDPTAESIHLQAHYIILRGGTLRAGRNATDPHPGMFTITLWGDREHSRRLPTFGCKVLANLDGTIQLFGAATTVPSWTELNTTADIGDMSIVVNGKVNWQAGNTIAIASSSYDARDVDRVLIRAVQHRADGTSIIHLASPLQYTHLGVMRSYSGDPRKHVLDMRAEVVVLDRNIVIQGDPSTPSTMFGGHVMSTWSKRTSAGYPSMQLSNVEVRQMGQAYQMGRYPIHFHLMGDASFNSWVSNCSIHDTWNRGVTIHGTHQVAVRHTTAFATTGHTFFLEDGIETGNILENNCGFLTQVSNAMLITDNNPATFWITNPNNTLIGNHAGGALEGFGFWYHLEDYPSGPSKTYSVCPKHEKMGIFKNNVAHSNAFYGLRIHPEYYQKADCGCCSGWNLKPAVFEGLIGYKNGVNCVVATQVGIIQYQNMTCADSGAGEKMLPVNGKDSGSHYEIIFEVDSRPRTSTPLTSMSGLFNSLAVAQTEEGLRGSLVPWPSNRWIAAVTAPQTLMGAWQHHAHMAIVNFTMIGFAGHSHAGSEFRALEHCAHCKDHTGGHTAFTRGLTFLPPAAALASARTPVSAAPPYSSYYDAALTRPRLFTWSWTHQGIFLDTDGSLINADTVAVPNGGISGGNWSMSECSAVAGASPFFNVTTQPMPPGGCTAHSGDENELFRPAECHRLEVGKAVICKPGITYRRVMLNNHSPQALAFRDMIVRDVETNTTAISHQSKYNEMGYVFTAAVGRTYWVHWDIPYRVDPVRFSLHKMDVLQPGAWLYIQTKQLQTATAFAVNNVEQEALTALPAPLNATSGAIFYSKASAFNNMYSWNGTSYNDTTATMLVAGPSNRALTLEPLSCAGGAATCDNLGVTLTQEVRNGTLLWSDNATWAGNSAAGGSKPVQGSNVNIPFGWNLVIDESPPPLGRVLIEGNVTFSSRRDINLTAAAIIVRSNGTLTAGNATSPHPRRAEILLTGNRNSSNILISKDVNAATKVLAPVSGGTVALFGTPVGLRWSKLAATAVPGSTSLLVAGTRLGWSPGGRVTVTSSSYNWAQAESRSILAAVESPSASTLAAAGFGTASGTAIYDYLAAAAPWTSPSSSSPGSTTGPYNVTLLTLDQPLIHTHHARVSNWDGLVADLRPEVAYTTSNIVVRAADGQWQQDGQGGEKFGVRVLATGPSLLQLDSVAVMHCGQAGFGRPCVHFDRLTPLRNNSRAANISMASRRPAPSDAVATAGLRTGINPSYINSSAVTGVFDLAVWISGADNPYMGESRPNVAGGLAAAVVSGNVLAGSLDVDTVRVDVRGAVVVDNLGWGTVKDMTGKSKFDDILPATFRVTVNDVLLRRNTAAGSERLGFYLAGEPCSTLEAAKTPTSITSAAVQASLLVVNNTAHSSLVGLMLEANDKQERCSGAVGFDLWRNWDYGVFTVKGITTSVTLIDITVAETKHVGVLLMYVGELTDNAEMQMHRVGFIGISGSESCSICNGTTPMVSGKISDQSCHQKLSIRSYNRETPFSPAVGLTSSVFALMISPGPENKPWDAVKGYPTVLGITRIQGAVFAGYEGVETCAGTGIQHPGAFAIGNHLKDPDAFHPMYFSGVRIPGTNRATGLLLSTPPDPAWLNEGDCADKAWNLSLPCCSPTQKVDMFAKRINPQQPPPNLLPINCAGPRHVLLRDLDGSLSGSNVSNTTILGGYTTPRHPGGVDTGAMVLPGVCRYTSSWGAYLCLPGKQESGLSNGWKPDPIAASGILGDPQFFVLESRDDDRETRVFAPVIFSLPGSGQVDLVTNAMDQGCCFGYGFCQKRLNAFWTVLPMGHTITVNFTGSPGRFWRVWLPYADPSTHLLLRFHMGDVVDRRYLYTAADGRLAPTANGKPPTLTDGSPGGSYHWDQVSMSLTMKMSGGDMYEIRTESVLYITPKLAMSVEDFWQQKNTFISSLASVLGIDPSRIRVVKVIAGSAVVDVEIGEEAKPLPENPFNMTYNMDMDTSRAAAAIVAQQVAQGTATYPIDLSSNPTFFPPPPPPPAPPSSTNTPTTDSSSQLLDPDSADEGPITAPAPAPVPPPPPPPAPPVSPPSSPSNASIAAAACSGAAAAACELGAVYLALTTALADGSAELSLGVPIKAITAEIKTPDESTRRAVEAAIIARAESAGVVPPPLPDPNIPTADLTHLAQQGREVIAAAPPPTTTGGGGGGGGGGVTTPSGQTQAPVPPAAPGTAPGSAPTQPPGSAPPGAPTVKPPSNPFPQAPGSGVPGPSDPQEPIAGPFGQFTRDFKALGIGAAFAGLAVVGVVGWVLVVRKRRRLTPTGGFTDLTSIMTGSGDAATAEPSRPSVVPTQLSRKRKGVAAAEAAALASSSSGAAASGPELDNLVGPAGFIEPATPSAASAPVPGPEAREKASLTSMKSLKRLFSGKWQMLISQDGASGGLESPSGRVMLPGSVPVGRNPWSSVPGQPKEPQQDARDSGEVVGSPRVQPLVSGRDSLRQRHGQQLPAAEGGVVGTSVMTSAETSIGMGLSGQPLQPQPPQVKQPEGRGRGKLPPLEGHWGVSGKP